MRPEPLILPRVLGLLLEGQVLFALLIGLVLVIAITLHELGHAVAADLQGDPTPRLAGRITLNPLRHLDPIGTAALVLAGFGWGKPVPFSPKALRNRRIGPALVGIAGPAVNVILALAAAIALVNLQTAREWVGVFLFQMLQINVLLALFNLIPIPPLDGSRLLTALLPPSKQQIVFFLDQWGFFILLALVFLVLPGVLGPVVNGISAWILGLFS